MPVIDLFYTCVSTVLDLVYFTFLKSHLWRCTEWTSSSAVRQPVAFKIRIKLFTVNCTIYLINLREPQPRIKAPRVKEQNTIRLTTRERNIYSNKSNKYFLSKVEYLIDPVCMLLTFNSTIRYLIQGGRGHWAVCYTSPQRFIILIRWPDNFGKF